MCSLVHGSIAMGIRGCKDSWYCKSYCLYYILDCNCGSCLLWKCRAKEKGERVYQKENLRIEIRKREIEIGIEGISRVPSQV